LVAVADALATAQDDWWLIGGAAVALHGLEIEIADIDVLLGRRDILRMLDKLGVGRHEDTAITRVRSDIWARWTAQPLSVDLMTGLQVHDGECWRQVEPRTREMLVVEGHELYVPSRSELIDILRLFGRPKDLDRARGLVDLALPE
jgi:hypothetical protein